MKLFIGLLIALAPAVSTATKIIGNGGDFRSMEFVRIAYLVLEVLESRPIPEVDLERLRETVRETAVESTDMQLVLDGKEKDAINYPSLKKIVFNRAAWDSRNENARVTFVFHEYLGLLGVNDSSYQYSSLLSGAVFYLRGADASLLMDIFEENKIFWGQTVQGFCSRSRVQETTMAYQCSLMDSMDMDKLKITTGRRARELWSLLVELRQPECNAAGCWISLRNIKCSPRAFGAKGPICRVLGR